MTGDPQTLQPITISDLDDRMGHALHEHLSLVSAERFPADAPTNFETRRRYWQTTSPAAPRRDWIVWSRDRAAIVAHAIADAPTSDEQAQVVIFDVTVQQADRRCGIGTALLAHIIAYAARHDRRVLLTQTQARIAAGGQWIARMGGVPSLSSETLQLVLATVDRDQLRRWIAQGAESNPQFELGFWRGRYPDADIASIARLHEVHNDAPRTSDAIDASRITPERLRAAEQQMLARGEERLTVFVRARSTGELVGCTEETWSRGDPTTIEQGITGVLPAYRKRGLGRWLKATMIDLILRELPSAALIRTGNAADNHAMITLNQALGFTTISVDTWWEIDRERARAYLGAAE